MKFVIFCEGHTERAVMADLLSRWLNPRLTQRVGFKRVRFDGWPQLVEETPKKAEMHLRDPGILGVISLLDLYGPTFYPSHLTTASKRREWGVQYMLGRFSDPRYRHHFAVHEVEAWVLSQPENLPSAVRKRLPGKIAQPEMVNFDEPPAKLLNKLYQETLHKDYKKVVEGTKLFGKLNPEMVYTKCPSFKALADDLLNLCPCNIRKAD
jgi:hypothetical protein